MKLYKTSGSEFHKFWTLRDVVGRHPDGHVRTKSLISLAAVSVVDTGIQLSPSLRIPSIEEGCLAQCYVPSPQVPSSSDCSMWV